MKETQYMCSVCCCYFKGPYGSGYSERTEPLMCPKCRTVWIPPIAQSGHDSQSPLPEVPW